MAEPELSVGGGSKATSPGFDVSQREEVAKLRKNSVGLGGVLFLTVTGAAPISAMLFNVPIMVGYGQGQAAPAAFMFGAIVLVIFSVGYVAMARKKTTAGGFYSYISHGLGRELGMGTGFGSVIAYSLFEASLCGGFAYFLGLKLQVYGISISWPWLALAMVVIISALTYFDVRLSSAVLAVGLIAEVVVLLIFDGFVLSRGHVNFGAINLLKAFQGFPAQGKIAAGAVGIGLFFAFWSWVGFEMAPNYAEESRDPKRIVPRALYISVIGLGVFYTLTTWAGVSGYPTAHAAIAQAFSNPSNFYLAPASKYAGPWLGSLMSYLIITGSFACGMAFHNTAARYFYSLGREGLMPKVLGRTHHKWKSPHIASITQSAIAALVIIGFALFTGTGNPTSQAYLQLYGLMAVMGVITILALQALVSLAIIVYYERFHHDETHWWRTRLAPALAFLSQLYVIYLLFSNFNFIGSGFGYAKWLGPIDLVIVLIGIGGAFYFKKKKPHLYEQAGRLINEGM